MAVALVALFVALSGVTWGAIRIEKSSVTSKQVKNNSLKSADLKNGKGVKGIDVVDDSLTGGEINEGTLAQVPSADRANTATSATSANTASNADMLDNLDSADFLRADAKATDADLLDGMNSTAFLGAGAKATDAAKLDGLNSADFLRSTVTVRESATTSVANNSISGPAANCNPGEIAIGGGVGWTATPGANTMVMLESGPTGTPDLSAWTVTVGNTSGSSKSFNVRAICVAVG